MDEGGVRSNDTLFSLKVLFEEIADGHRLAARQKNLMFTVSFSGLDTIVCCDGSHIRQIADNLLSNALKFAPEKQDRIQHHASPKSGIGNSYGSSFPIMGSA